MRKTHCLTHESIKIAFWCVTELILRTKVLFSIFAVLWVGNHMTTLTTSKNEDR